LNAAQSEDGYGKPEFGLTGHSEDKFGVGFDEKGQKSESRRYPWHEKALGRLAGATPKGRKEGWFSWDKYDPADIDRGVNMVHEQLGRYTLKQLHVEPDKE